MQAVITLPVKQGARSPHGGGHAAGVAGDGVGLRVVREYAAHAHATAGQWEVPGRWPTMRPLG